MKMLFGDFETYYNSKQGYTLKKITPVEYILDPRFEMCACAIAEGDETPMFLEHDDFVSYLARYNPDDVCFVSHNALFDACILAWRYNFYPQMYIDTMGMARATINHKTGHVSLDAVQKHFNIGSKGYTIHKVDGMTADMIKAADMWFEYACYGIDDCHKMREIFKLMAPTFPMSELLVMDGVIRCAVNPKFRLDVGVLSQHLAEVKAKKEMLLARTGLQSREALMSNEMFARALQSLGVSPPRKISLRTGQETWAFAKTDQAFAELEEHPNPDVQALVAARMGIKTTLEETRTQRMLAISRLLWPPNPNVNPGFGAFLEAWMPIPLKYSGAHTHRLSGDWKLNVQNFTRGGNLRKSLKAPQGYKIVAADASQIEARLTAWFCGQEDLRQAFEDGDDIYSIFAAEEIFHRHVDKSTKTERFIGKQAILGAGFSAGGKKFAWMVETLSRIMLGYEVPMDEVEGKRIISAYRRRYRNISNMWPQLVATLTKIARGERGVLGPNGVVAYGKDHIRLPNGLSLYYDDLQFDAQTDSWQFTFAKKKNFLHGGKVLENIIQALARIIVMDAAVRMRKKYSLHYSLQVHDELVYIVPTNEAQQVLDWLLEEMTTRPYWGPTIPLAAEGGIGDSYGDIK